LALLIATACGGASAPTAPSATAATGATGVTTASSLALSGATMSPSVVQVTATAVLADGTTRDVTAASTWTTSNASVAVVSPSGLVTVVGSGDVDIRAAYQNLAGSLRLALSQKFTITGVVTDGPPTKRPLANARLVITSGPDSGAAVLSDAHGAFRFNTVTAGVVSMDATEDGYLLWRVTGLTMDRDREINLDLYPAPPLSGSGTAATARCTDGTWSWVSNRDDACAGDGGVLYGVCPGPLCDVYHLSGRQ
jgi:Carboxypeptidase regulatory-like domain